MSTPSLAERAAHFGNVAATAQFSSRSGPLEAEVGMAVAMELLQRARRDGNAVYVIGNGGSAAVAAHIVNDLVNVAGLRCQTLHDAAVLTCMANDYGYENAFARLLRTMAKPGDVLIAISSSGKSANICNAVEVATAAGLSVFTLSGFRPDNSLRAMGDLNVWVGAEDYGIVEIAHLFVLHTLADRFREDI